MGRAAQLGLTARLKNGRVRLNVFNFVSLPPSTNLPKSLTYRALLPFFPIPKYRSSSSPQILLQSTDPPPPIHLRSSTQFKKSLTMDPLMIPFHFLSACFWLIRKQVTLKSIWLTLASFPISFHLHFPFRI
ncbi:hypothetical protein ES319_D02G112700v1 [Gossypium barbadense]|uniref:Uncharacterized protein n=2 Tax=Gossypium TaxID=3633 RepID=A0A5J5SDB9_GOSBA|nr:hypothetical protein ES319_D02G112700v1 [Gossypium barbadense]KAB2040878.1 hypothetical protein ES319_D02G112700v1 [Gossypium barbadense]TYG79183.1 hypothetical protein ES288_D02G120500v1 [Gossypium darwinii]